MALLAALALTASAHGAAAPPAVGPGPFATAVSTSGYRVSLAVTPNQAGLVDSAFVVRCTHGGRPVPGAVRLRFTMRAMPMPSLSLRLTQLGTGVWRGHGRKLTMPGRWEIVVHVSPQAAAPFDVRVTDSVTVGTRVQ